jgi:hypothetical protein
MLLDGPEGGVSSSSRIFIVYFSFKLRKMNTCRGNIIVFYSF